jgi:2-hydroxycyclohexanecarboxyl-CoA dehydrogenase
LAQAGHTVVVADLLEAEGQETATAIAEAGGDALYVNLDVTQAESVTNALSSVNEQRGRVDILVNNAGWDEHLLFVSTDENFWQKVLNVNFLGALRTTHAVLPQMLESGWGRVINIGSDAGRVGSSLEAVYSGAKGGIVGFSKALAREVARSGITVNVVCPGPTDTPMLQHMLETSPNAAKIVSAMTRAVPMKRIGHPDEIAAAVSFFAQEDAGYITGQTLSVSGGLTMA